MLDQREHRASRPPVDLTKPSAGFYRTRDAKGQPWLPVLIYPIPARDPDTKQAMDRAPTLACTIDGVDATEALAKLWQVGRFHPVKETEYLQLVRARRLTTGDDLNLMTSEPAL
jgi:hypothetical protein